MKKNVGDLDAYLRLICGFTMIGYGISKKSKLPILLGSMKVAEGLTRWCPVLAMFGASTNTCSNDEDEADILWL